MKNFTIQWNFQQWLHLREGFVSQLLIASCKVDQDQYFMSSSLTAIPHFLNLLVWFSYSLNLDITEQS